jgi:hypothetical protein
MLDLLGHRLPRHLRAKDPAATCVHVMDRIRFGPSWDMRKIYAEGGAPARFALNNHAAIVLLYDARGGRRDVLV